MITNIDNDKIINNSKYNNLFLSASLNDINENCKILKSSFYLDSFNYFPVTKNYETFKNLFKRQDNNSIDNFYTKIFFENFKKNEKNFKKFEDCFILGSSPSDNYYSNLIHFLPRLFFNNEKHINLIIHRNLSNKFRSLLKNICNLREVQVNFNYIDDDFYQFNDSTCPQFFNIEKSIKILQYFFKKILENVKDLDYGKRIYIRREDADYRKILNEADLIEKLRKNNFQIINPNHFEILEQMKIFSCAEIIISPHGSNLSNIIFCNSGSKIYEIGPKFDNSYEINISNRYNQLSNVSNINYYKIDVDSVDVANHSTIAEKYISKKILNESNYYKNLIIKINQIDKLIDSL
tara:strand:+ start:1140 stop:2189 length:1050 start_codon:yes stop_codon:yes gene_type:complete